MTKPRYDNLFWDGTEIRDQLEEDVDLRCQLIFSLMTYSNVTIFELLRFIFSTTIPSIHHRASLFLADRSTSDEHDNNANTSTSFHPATILKLWYKNFPKARPGIDRMIQPYARDIVLHESDKIIENKSLKVIAKSQELAPFTWDLLWTISASPNDHRKALTL
ncbi:hypothetical protein DFP72DRAFT_917895, partial [Ephemerocybe angulata]